MHEPRTVEEGSWKRWVTEGTRGLLSAPGCVIAVIAVSMTISSLGSMSPRYVGILIHGLAAIPTMSLLMRLALVSNGLETGIVSQRFMFVMLLTIAIGFVCLGSMVFAFSLLIGSSDGTVGFDALSNAVTLVLLIPWFFMTIFSRRLFMMDRIVLDGFGIVANDGLMSLISKGAERNRSELRAVKAVHNAVICVAVAGLLFAEGDLLVAIQIGQLVLGCVVWSWYGAALRDIFFGGLEERERRLVPSEAT